MSKFILQILYLHILYKKLQEILDFAYRKLALLGLICHKGYHSGYTFILMRYIDFVAYKPPQIYIFESKLSLSTMVYQMEYIKNSEILKNF